jgi:hypothetical protein
MTRKQNELEETFTLVDAGERLGRAVSMLRDHCASRWKL